MQVTRILVTLLVSTLFLECYSGPIIYTTTSKSRVVIEVVGKNQMEALPLYFDDNTLYVTRPGSTNIIAISRISILKITDTEGKEITTDLFRVDAGPQIARQTQRVADVLETMMFVSITLAVAVLALTLNK